MKRFMVLVIALVLTVPTASALAAKKAKKAEDAQSTQKEEGNKKKGTFKEFSEVTEDATLLEGFFDVYQKPDQLLLAVPENRLGEDFLMSFTLAQGVGTGWLIGGSMMNWEALLVCFERHGNTVYLVSKPHRYTASDPGYKSMVDFAFGSSVLASAEILSIRDKDKAAVIDVDKWFVSDLSGVGEMLRSTLSPGPGQRGNAQLESDKSFIEQVKVFPENVNVRAKLTFKPGEPVDWDAVPDGRSVPLSVHCVMARLPTEPMEPRVADDRMGYFLLAQKDFARPEQSFFTRYIRKWRLEPDRKRDELYIPKKPITYYIDSSVPPELRPYVQAGIEEWNRAFEAAGFDNAMRADLLPREADPEDLRYATIRWVATDVPSYGAIGPSVVDPRTGEVLDADVLFDASITLWARRTWRTLADPARAIENALGLAAALPAPAGPNYEHAGFADQLTMHMALVRASLLLRGDITPQDPVPIEFVGEFLKFITMHEVGHTLGLRHNFRGSTDTPMAKLHDRIWTGDNGLVNSVMEYPAPNLAIDGKPNGHYYTPTVGTWDRWAIAFGYMPDAAKAAALARQAAQDGNLYGTDEDAGGIAALDPTVNVWDLGDDPLGWSKERSQLIRGIWSRLPQAVLYDGQPHYELTNALMTLLVGYVQALAPAVKYIGGQEVNRDHFGDPQARAPFIVVPKAKQREALDHVVQSAFSETAFVMPREVLTQLGSNRWSHWGQPNTILGRVEVPLHELVLLMQGGLLDLMTNPVRLSRLVENESLVGAQNVLSIPEMMEALSGAVWSEVWGAQPHNVTSMRRNLQRLYVDRMTAILTHPPSRMPADARAVTRVQLRELQTRLQRAIAAGATLDAYTRAHLTEIQERVEKALDAGLEVELLGGRG